MSKTTLTLWLERLDSIHPSEMDLGLERVTLVANRLDLLPVTVPVITVAGTNGKGSTAAVMEAVLGATGTVAGVCSSPHFVRFNERIRVAGLAVEDAVIIAAFEKIDAARAEVSLTYFEFAALAALLVFEQLQVELMILEVGLGGRLDAINMVDASVSVITSIALDHQQWLGDSRELIAIEKAGVFRPGQMAVISDPVPPASLVQAAKDTSVQALYFGQDFNVSESAGRWRGTVVNIDGSQRALPTFNCGALLPVNICAAAQALLCAGEKFSDQQLSNALQQLQLPGRRQSVEVSGHSYLLDVAHNPAAIDKLLEYIDISPCNGKTIALFSVMADKDVLGMLRPCLGHFDAWFLADQTDNARAAAAASIAQLLQREGADGISVSENITEAFRLAKSTMSEGDRLVVFGSFHTVAAVLPFLENDSGKDSP